jgi:hypothetical protein
MGARILTPRSGRSVDYTTLSCGMTQFVIPGPKFRLFRVLLFGSVSTFGYVTGVTVPFVSEAEQILLKGESCSKVNTFVNVL